MGSGIGGYHMRVRVEVPVGDDSPEIKMTGEYTYRFVNLRYRVVERIIANGVFDDNGVAIKSQGSQIQSNNYLVGCSSFLTLTFDIPNITEVNNW
jgi:hypothetical protein